jgi:hypothetical protein
MYYICANNIRNSTFILTILKNYYKFGNDRYTNLKQFLDVLCLPGYKNYITPEFKRYVDLLFFTVGLHTKKFEAFRNIPDISRLINDFIYFKSESDELVRDMDANKMGLTYISQYNVIPYMVFTLNSENINAIFPFIYNNNILDDQHIDISIIMDFMSNASISKYRTELDIYGNTIYHYIAMYYMYNYSVYTHPRSYDRIQMVFRINTDDIIGLTNRDGWSIIDILSIMPINFDIIREEKVRENIIAHIEFLIEMYTSRGFRDTDKILVYRHILAKYFYIFEGVNTLLEMINCYIRDKPTIDNQYITNPLFDLYKYCSREDSSTLTDILRNYDHIKRLICNKIPSQRLYDRIVEGYEGQRVIPSHPFPREKWYILLPVNSPLPQFIIPMKLILKQVLEDEKRNGINDSLAVVYEP